MYFRWFEVVDKKIEFIPPVQYACECVQTKEKEIRKLIALHTAEPKRNINPFTMRLQGNIDATVMGGMIKFRDAFLTPEFIKENPEMLPHVNRLKSVILDQINVLESALVLHEQIAPPNVQPLHKRLIESFRTMKQAMAPFLRQRLVSQDSIIK